MKIAYASDLHLEIWRDRGEVIVPSDADVVVLAGDVSCSAYSEYQIKTLVVTRDLPVVYVEGNHEHYRERLQLGTRVEDMAKSRISLLERSSVVISGVRFLGCTLWTDYFGGNPIVMLDAANGLNDHRLISYGSRKFTPEDALAIHRESVAWLESELSKPFDGKTVVVTHHAPSLRSVSEKFRGDRLNGCFVSDLDWLVEKSGAALWIHGHTHDPYDYVIGDTRVVCNPRGYPLEHDNETFALRVIEL
jgi:predicted phosphodiesterase